MNLTESIAPKSDQWNADDLISGPVTVTIKSITKGSNEQPVNVHLVETPTRAYRPSKSMRRVMVVAWDKESDIYAGRRLTLFLNPEIKYAGVKVGGIEIAAMSHIDKPLTLMITRSKGRRESFTVEPLADATPVATNPNAELLAEIGALADKTPGGRKSVAADWAETHEGEHLRDATDLGRLELLRDDLKASAS